jgi:hypothetical protein
LRVSDLLHNHPVTVAIISNSVHGVGIAHRLRLRLASCARR